MFVTFRKWTALYIIYLFLFAFVFVAIMKYGSSIPASNNNISAINRSPVLIIDPGHGGEDGGAVGSDGTIESHLNLEIALKAECLAKLIGFDVCMTRHEDISIHDADAESLRQKKISDLKNRVLLCESTENCILLSIHQNSLPGIKSVCGAQIFYNNTDNSRKLASIVQKELNQHLNGDNIKEEKHIGENSYLMKNVTCPAILVECGFLSNPNECQLLKTKEHQNKIAIILINSLTHWIEN